MTPMQPVELLDNYYAEMLCCTPAEFSGAKNIVVPHQDMKRIRFAHGLSLAVYAMSKSQATVFALKPDLADILCNFLKDAPPCTLNEELCNEVEYCLAPYVNAAFWFRGYRLFCEPATFVDCSFGEVRDITAEDPSAWHMSQFWGGPVFGQIVDGKPVTWCCVKTLSDTVWDLSIETHPDYRGRGYAKSTVSTAVKYCFAHGKLVGWGCDRDNVASLRTALSVGFQHYALDFGCEEKTQ
ncbi:MAG: GNAT family N-acetyltransferase [Armatimonadota bacterium]|nr:GNAT family N-acetyltransferase [Armatimonadota bacterium]